MGILHLDFLMSWLSLLCAENFDKCRQRKRVSSFPSQESCSSRVLCTITFTLCSWFCKESEFEC